MWQKLTIKTPNVANKAAPVISSIHSGLSFLTNVVSTISAAIDLVKNFVTGVVDRFKPIVGTIIDELENIENDLYATGCYALVITPWNVSGEKKYDTLGIPVLTVQSAINEAIKSFDDKGDENRPQFSDEANVAAFGILVTAPNLDNFIDLLKRVIQVFYVFDWEFTIKKLERYNEENPISSVPPDWFKLAISSIGFFKDVKKDIKELKETIKGYLVVADNNLVDLLNVAAFKVNSLQKILTEFEHLLNTITSVSGVYVLRVPITVGGNTKLKAEIHDTFLEGPCVVNQYSTMLLLVGGGPSAQIVDYIGSITI